MIAERLNGFPVLVSRLAQFARTDQHSGNVATYLFYLFIRFTVKGVEFFRRINGSGLRQRFK